jgi:UPF0755 protein
MSRRLPAIVLSVVTVVGGGAVLAGTWIWARAHEPYRGYGGVEQFVEVPPGASPGAIGRALVTAGVVESELLFRAAVWWSGAARDLKAGEYRFDRAMSPVEVVAKIARGDAYARRLTIPEGLTLQEMAAVVESSGFGAASAFLEAARDESPIRSLDSRAQDLEGYLFPDTYALPRRATAGDLVPLMVDRFLEVYDESMRSAAQAQKLTTREVVTLASLVEKETAKAEERPLVAAVYRNRLRIGMGMQADPTVVYALRLAGRYDGNIRREDLNINSPYNTYRYRGLPPGPIASPGEASLEAAIAPADVPYLYFVSRNDGSHVFAETLAEHNRNVQEWQVRFFQRQRRR